MAASILEVSGVTKVYATEFQLNDTSFRVAPREIFSIIGDSGAGKSTILGIIGGHIKPDTGRVFLNGIDITGIPASRRPTSTVFQDLALFPHLNVFDNIAYPLRVRGIDKKEIVQRVSEMLTAVGMHGFEMKKISTLSGGEKQRVAFGRALIWNPSVLLLDEPFEGLDIKLRERVREFTLEFIKRFDIATVFVTHNQQDAFAISDRIAVLRQGKILQIGSPEEVYYRPVSLDVAKFVGKLNILEGKYLENAGQFITKGNTRIMIRNRVPRTFTVLGLRPEDIRIQISPDPNSALVGKVVSKEFVGDHYLFKVRVNESETMEILVADKAIADRVLPDEQVGLVIEDKKVMCFL